MSEISPLAFVDPAARIGRDVRIAPFAFVGADVALGDGCIVHPHATLLGPGTFGARNVFWPHCCIGAAPQDLKYRGGRTQIIAGDDNVFRENVTIHRGTEVDQQSSGVTRIGNHNLIMVGVHVAHDAIVGNHCIIANNVLIAGHVVIEDYCNIAGAAAMHHFTTVGRLSFVTGMTRIVRDVPPYTIVQGFDGVVKGMNLKGMERWKIGPESISAIDQAGRVLFPRRESARTLSMVDALREVEDSGLTRDQHVRYLVDFLRRQRETSVSGRVRERERSDTASDRDSFYRLGREGNPS